MRAKTPPARREPTGRSTPSPAGLTPAAGPTALLGWLSTLLPLDLPALVEAIVRDAPSLLRCGGAALYCAGEKSDRLTLAASADGWPAPLSIDAPASGASEYHDIELRCDARLIGVLRLFEPRNADEGAINAITPVLSGLLGQARLLERTRVEARIDPLTGLRNRRWADEALRSEIGRAERSGLPLAVLSLDLDGLKPLNDTFGHATGDAVLRHVSRLIQGLMRRSDVASRIGGDEFLIMLPATDRDGAERLAERILERLEEDPPIHDGLPLTVGASIGSAVWVPGWDAERLIAAADTAMYDDKRAGRRAASQPAQPNRAPISGPDPRPNGV